MVALSLFSYLITPLLYLGCVQAGSSESKNKAREKKSILVFIRPKNSAAREIQYINRYDNTVLLEFGQEDTIRINSSEPINVLNVDKNNVRFFRFFPNDTIQVIKETGYSVPIYLSGNATRDKELMYLSKNSYIFFSPYTKTVKNPAKDIDEQAKQEHVSLKKYAQAGMFTQSFVTEESENINYLRLSKLIALLLTKPNLTQVDLAPFQDIFKNSHFTYLMSFKQMSDYYLKAVKAAFKNDATRSFNWINSTIRGDARDILFFKLLKSTDATKKNDIKSQLIAQYSSLAKDTLYRNYLLQNQELANVKYLGKNKNLIVDNRNRTKTINSLIESLKNKVIFIDLWASWCVPCRAEMPFSKKLKQDLINHKDIAFLYLSLDKDKAMWENAEKDLNLDPGESYLFIDSFNAEFLKNLEVKTIPRYLVINKDGSINQSDALRPREPKLKEDLLRLAK